MSDPFLIKTYIATLKPVFKELLQEILAEQKLIISSASEKSEDEIVDTTGALKILGLKDRHSLYDLKNELPPIQGIGKGNRYFKKDVIEFALKRKSNTK